MQIGQNGCSTYVCNPPSSQMNNNYPQQQQQQQPQQPSSRQRNSMPPFMPMPNSYAVFFFFFVVTLSQRSPYGPPPPYGPQQQQPYGMYNGSPSQQQPPQQQPQQQDDDGQQGGEGSSCGKERKAGALVTGDCFLSSSTFTASASGSSPLQNLAEPMLCLIAYDYFNAPTVSSISSALCSPTECSSSFGGTTSCDCTNAFWVRTGQLTQYTCCNVFPSMDNERGLVSALC